MSVERVLRDTLATVLAELERLDAQSLTAARARGVLDAVAAYPARDGFRAVRGPHPGRIDRHRSIADLYASGLTMGEVAEKAGCSKITVANALKSTGTPARPRGFTTSPARPTQVNTERLERIKHYRAEGMTLEEIGALEKITRERVRQLCMRAGIATPRPELKPNEIAAVADYLAGASINTAAEAAGIAPSRMVRVLYQAGHKPRPANKVAKHSAEVAEKARRSAELYNSGITVAEIAKTLGVSAAPVIYRYLAIAGVRPKRTGRSRARAAQAPLSPRARHSAELECQ